MHLAGCLGIAWPRRWRRSATVGIRSSVCGRCPRGGRASAGGVWAEGPPTARLVRRSRAGAVSTSPSKIPSPFDRGSRSAHLRWETRAHSRQEPCSPGQQEHKIGTNLHDWRARRIGFVHSRPPPANRRPWPTALSKELPFAGRNLSRISLDQFQLFGGISLRAVPVMCWIGVRRRLMESLPRRREPAPSPPDLASGSRFREFMARFPLQPRVRHTRTWDVHTIADRIPGLWWKSRSIALSTPGLSCLTTRGRMYRCLHPAIPDTHSPRPADLNAGWVS